MQEIGIALRALFPRTGAHAGTEEDALKTKLVRDAFNYILSKVVPGLIGLMAVPVFVRIVGIDQYGRYAMVFSVVMAWSAGMAGWLSQGVLRFQSAATQASERRIFNQAVAQGVGLSALIGAICLLIAFHFIGLGTGWGLIVAIVLFISTIVYTVYLARLQASLHSKSVKRSEFVRSIAGFLFPLLLILATHFKSYVLLLGGVGAGYLLPLAFYFSSSKTAAKTLREARSENRSPAALKSLWSFGWPIGVWLLCQQSLVVSDRYFIQRFSGFSSAGVYASVYDVVVRSFSLLFMPITLAVHPLVMDRWNAGDHRNAFSAVRTGLKYQVMLLIPVIILLTILAPVITHVVLGGRNPQAIALVLPLIFVGFLWQISLLVHKPLEVLCQTKKMLLGMAGALSVNVAGNCLFIPAFGYPAAAYVGIASSLTYLGIVAGLMQKNGFLNGPEIAGPSVIPEEEAVLAERQIENRS